MRRLKWLVVARRQSTAAAGGGAHSQYSLLPTAAFRRRRPLPTICESALLRPLVDEASECADEAPERAFIVILASDDASGDVSLLCTAVVVDEDDAAGIGGGSGVVTLNGTASLPQNILINIYEANFGYIQKTELALVKCAFT